MLIHWRPSAARGNSGRPTLECSGVGGRGGKVSGYNGGWWEGEEPNLNFVSGRQERWRDDGGELEVEAKVRR